jgi:hypothetical protein
MAHNMTRETIGPSDALRMIADTLNNPSVWHERIDMKRVYQATAELLESVDKSRIPKLAITRRGAVVVGLEYVMAMVHAWKPCTFDIARGVRGRRIGARRAAFVMPEIPPREIRLGGRRHASA